MPVGYAMPAEGERPGPHPKPAAALGTGACWDRGHVDRSSVSLFPCGRRWLGCPRRSRPRLQFGSPWLKRQPVRPPKGPPAPGTSGSCWRGDRYPQLASPVPAAHHCRHWPPVPSAWFEKQTCSEESGLPGEGRCGGRIEVVCACSSAAFLQQSAPCQPLVQRGFWGFPQTGLQIAAGVGTSGSLRHPGGMDAGQPDREPLGTLLHADGVAIADREHRGANLRFSFRQANGETAAPRGGEGSGTDSWPPDHALSRGSISARSAGRCSLRVIHTSSRSTRS